MIRFLWLIGILVCDATLTYITLASRVILTWSSHPDVLVYSISRSNLNFGFTRLYSWLEVKFYLRLKGTAASS